VVLRQLPGDNVTDLAKEQSAPTRDEWLWKLDGVAAAVAKMEPTILCLQEIENRKVLFNLMKKLKDDHKLDYRIAFVDGEDYFTEQDVGILYRSGCVEFGRREQTAEMKKDKSLYYLPKHIFARFAWGDGGEREELTLYNFHFRAQPEGGEFRARQARLLRRWVAEDRCAGKNVVLIGDTNTEETYPGTTANGDIGVLRGLDTPAKEDDFEDLHKFLTAEMQPTHIIHKQFDRIIVSPSLLTDEPGRPDLVFRGIANRKDLNTRGKEQDQDHWNIYYKIPQEERDLSDHFPIVAEFEFK
jgi:endonuclease/exonuclease/phosphatase family metal-dependent hydrolase